MGRIFFYSLYAPRYTLVQHYDNQCQSQSEVKKKLCREREGRLFPRLCDCGAGR